MKKKLSVLVLALTMVLTMSVSVFAADPVPSGSGDTAKLVKYLKINDAVTFPADASFKFIFTPADSTASESDTVASNTYANVPKEDFAAFDFTITAAQLNKTANKVDGGYALATAIKDIFPANEFKVNGTIRAGVYSFTVTEDKGGTTATVNDGKMTYDGSSFTLRVGIKNDGTIADVTVSTPEGKVDPTDTDPTDAENPPQGKTKGFTFINNYEKMVTEHYEPDPTDPTNPDKFTKVEGALKVEKLVTGQYGDLTKKFAFTATVTIPDNTTVKDATHPDGYDLAANTPSDAAMQIKSGDSFVYPVLPVGTKITVTETAANQGGYTTTFAGTKQSVANATEFVLTEDGQFIKVTNAFDDSSVTPTGIIINNLPYVLLIGIALGGIVLFSRKRRYE